MLALGVLDDLVVVEEVFDGFLLAIQLILQNLNLRLQLYVLLAQLVVKHLHFNSLIVQLLLLLTLKPALTRLALGKLRRVSIRGWKSRAHHRAIWVRAVARAESVGGSETLHEVLSSSCS